MEAYGDQAAAASNQLCCKSWGGGGGGKPSQTEVSLFKIYIFFKNAFNSVLAMARVTSILLSRIINHECVVAMSNFLYIDVGKVYHQSVYVFDDHYQN